MKATPISRGILMALLAAWLSLAAPTVHATDDPIKVGILHSLSGSMASSESILKDTVLMLIADQNKKGGLLGRKLEPVVVEPASDWGTFAEKAADLLVKNGLLYFLVQYEGEESSRNIFYLGAAPSQQAIPSVRYLMSKSVIPPKAEVIQSIIGPATGRTGLMLCELSDYE